MLRIINQIRTIATTSAIRSTATAATAEQTTQYANKLHVSNLPWTVGSQTLVDYFTDFGPVVRAEVIFDRQTGISRGFGFVTFEFTHSYVKALQTENQMLEGRLLKISQSKYKPDEKDMVSTAETKLGTDFE